MEAQKGDVLKQGDVVKLKSGGPRMTVLKPSTEQNQMTCIWYDSESHDYTTRDFEVQILECAD